MNSALQMVSTLLSDLSSNQTISQGRVAGIEEVLGEKYITSIIPLNKFTVQESRVNFSNAFDHLVDKILEKYEVNIPDMKTMADIIYNSLCSFKTLLLSDKFSTSIFFQFLNEPLSCMMLNEKEEPTKITDMKMSFIFGDRFPIFARRYSEYLKSKITDNDSKTYANYLADLDSMSYDANGPKPDEPIYSIGWFTLLMSNSVETGEVFNRIGDDFTVAQFLDLVTPSNLKNCICNLDYNIEKISGIKNKLSVQNVFDRTQFAQYLEYKIVLESYKLLNRSLVCYNIVRAITLGDMWITATLGLHK